MQRLLTLLVLCASISGCAQTPYITSCDQAVCTATASLASHPYRPQTGLAVVTSPAIEFTVENDITKIADQGDILMIFSAKWKLGATTLSNLDIGLEGDKTSMKEFMEMVFLRGFPAIDKEQLNASTLHAVRSFKITSFGDGIPQYFKRDGLSVFYYQHKGRGQHKIYIVDEAFDDVATMLDLYSFSDERFQRFLSSLH